MNQYETQAWKDDTNLLPQEAELSMYNINHSLNAVFNDSYSY